MGVFSKQANIGIDIICGILLRPFVDLNVDWEIGAPPLVSASNIVNSRSKDAASSETKCANGFIVMLINYS
jgi:hypothetical protein